MKKILNHLRTFFYLLPNIISVFFSKPETINYPKESSIYSTGFRGSVRINEQNCVGCSMCVLDCPASALELKKESKKNFTLIHNQDLCTYCGQCQQSCKFDAIYMDNLFNKPSTDRKDFRVVLVDRNEEEE